VFTGLDLGKKKRATRYTKAVVAAVNQAASVLKAVLHKDQSGTGYQR
jgi:hypothetical protein